jgi:hypothetical protein
MKRSQSAKKHVTQIKHKRGQHPLQAKSLFVEQYGPEHPSQTAKNTQPRKAPAFLGENKRFKTARQQNLPTSNSSHQHF